jgi:hypothetical protein
MTKHTININSNILYQVIAQNKLRCEDIIKKVC